MLSNLFDLDGAPSGFIDSNKVLPNHEMFLLMPINLKFQLRKRELNPLSLTAVGRSENYCLCV
jgi:hypothetical protein